ncbi:hypothetical protein CF386_07460 [Paraphotobacterium marinum]|uniref:Acyltransferase 3 domain-containing protein n=1 Tax=Paraphotobacterium marinum TaxID=1755811 RepID=A0A220VEW2_9GAMM|nr:acyltransferase [Paraphotobacterium marinum]ASK78897.1 hypothetical protein CF386_07460 [Paraphotobacterium marinum]
MKKPRQKRMYYLDNIKWLLAIVVIFHHSFDFLKNKFTSYYIGFDTVNAIDQSYFMDLFFFISAFFIVPSFLKKGKAEFNKDKIIRLGGAVLITILLVMPIQYDSIKEYLGTKSSYLSYLYTQTISFQWGTFMGVTWFCWTLLVFTLIWSQFTDKKSIQEKSDKPLPSLIKIIVFCLIMIPINLIALKVNGILGDGFLGFHYIKYFPTYIAAFILGIKAYQNNWLDKIDFKYGLFGLVIFLFFISGISNLTSFSFNISNSFEILRTPCAVGMILFLLYIFKTFFNHSNKVTKVLARASFPAYVVQFIFLGLMFKFVLPHLSWNPWWIAIFIGAVATIASFILGIILYCLPIFRRIF